jgi:hypothetical protein
MRDRAAILERAGQPRLQDRAEPGRTFVPGYLAAEFIAGPRTRYLGPLKLYFLTALFFLIAPRVTDNFERQLT